MRFYGGHPLGWLRMPGRVRDGMLWWIPRLQAEEALTSANAVALGVGAQGSKDRQKALGDLLRGWQRAMGQQPTQRPRTWEEHLAALRARGINVVVDGEAVAA